jgi:hypothetical protein
MEIPGNASSSHCLVDDTFQREIFISFTDGKKSLKQRLTF